MTRLILGLVAAATITAGASAAAVKALPPPASSSWAGASSGANVAGISPKDQMEDLGRLDAIQSYAVRDTGILGSGMPGYNFQSRQFACIKVGHRLQC
jgi:opacity protein-like surface antigen